MLAQPYTLLTDICRILSALFPSAKAPQLFLGIELDTIKLELRLPADKLEHFQSTIHKWYIKLFLKGKPFCKRKELESLIGLLHDASIVVRPGRSFLCCLTI